MTIEELWPMLDYQRKDNLPYVLFKKPGSNTLQAYLSKEPVISGSSKISDSGFVFGSFDNQKKYFFENNKCDLFSIRLVASENTPTNNHINITKTISKENYIRKIEECIEEIKSTELEKVVMSRKVSVEIESDEFMLLRNLMNKYPDAFVYLWYHPAEGAWLGATPEKLLSIRDKKFYTMALAGTKFNDDKLWTQKEIREQEIVSEYILRQIEKYVSNIKKAETKTVQAGKLFHLETQISADILNDLENMNFLINAMHPTPAVCGYPIKAAANYIVKNEGYNREFYTGFLGEILIEKNSKRGRNNRNFENQVYFKPTIEANLFVNLRCMKLEDSTASLYAGGGITLDSVPEAEWEETDKKLDTILSIL